MKTAVVVGVGPGLGLALVKRFAAGGMKVVASARDAARLTDLVRTAGVEAQAIACDASVRSDVERLFAGVGAPEVVVFNAGAFLPGSILDVPAEDFERCWRIGCMGGFHVGQVAARAMVAAGRGTILFTGATASLRGSAKFANLAVPKFGLRALAQSMARELGPLGVHVAHVVVDGQIDVTGTGAESKLAPAAIAEVYHQLAVQPKSAWTHELDLRPSVERF